MKRVNARTVSLWSRDLEVNSADDTVRLAGEIADNASRDTKLRALAADITRNCVRIDVSGAVTIARWVRKHIRYRQETPGVEVLQGPYTTLKYRVGDCDDLVILWVALCRSIGLDVAFSGVRRTGSKSYVHAIGYAPKERTFYELTDDRAYSGLMNPILTPRLPQGCEAVYWHAPTGDLVPAEGGGAPLGASAIRMIDRPGVVWGAIAAAAALIAWSS